MSSRTDDVVGVNHGAQQVKTGPLHVPFSWLHMEKHNRHASFIESVADMCAGLQTCLQLVQATDLALHARSMGDDEAVPVLGPVDHERLLRLAIAVTGVLADSAHEEIERINEEARKG